MADARLISALDPYELWKILAQLQPNAYEFVPGAQKFGVRERGRGMIRYFRTVDELEEFIRTARKNPGWSEPETTEAPRAADLKTDGEAVRRELILAREQIRRLEEINAELREKGLKVVAERDRWEEKAKVLERELARNRGSARAERSRAPFGQRAGPGDTGANAKIKKAKIAFAKLYHPNNLRGSGAEAAIRAEIFKEFWEQLEKLEEDG